MFLVEKFCCVLQVNQKECDDYKNLGLHDYEIIVTWRH